MPRRPVRTGLEFHSPLLHLAPDRNTRALQCLDSNHERRHCRIVRWASIKTGLPGESTYLDFDVNSESHGLKMETPRLI